MCCHYFMLNFELSIEYNEFEKQTPNQFYTYFVWDFFLKLHLLLYFTSLFSYFYYPQKNIVSRIYTHIPSTFTIYSHFSVKKTYNVVMLLNVDLYDIIKTFNTIFWRFFFYSRRMCEWICCKLDLNRNLMWKKFKNTSRHFFLSNILT